ncbi:MAG: hypothetical protein ACOYOU_19165 [Kiritimatiellia bacterium]
MRERKEVVVEERVRRVPKQFSWIDHRLVRDGFCRRCRPEELALYLALVTVGDAEGLSYYGERSLARLITVAEPAVAAARDGLIRADLVAFRHPIYQVLELPEGRA